MNVHTQRAIVAMNFLQRILQTFASNVVAKNFAWLIAIERIYSIEYLDNDFIKSLVFSIFIAEVEQRRMLYKHRIWLYQIFQFCHSLRNINLSSNQKLFDEDFTSVFTNATYNRFRVKTNVEHKRRQNKTYCSTKIIICTDRMIVHATNFVFVFDRTSRSIRYNVFESRSYISRIMIQIVQIAFSQSVQT